MALDETGMLVKLEASVAKFQKDLERSQKAHQRFAQRMEGQARQSADRMKSTYAKVPDGIAAAFNNMKGLAMPFAGGFLGGLTAGGISGIVNNLGRVTKEVANLSNEAQRAGIGVEAFQEWKFVAEQNRIGIDALTDGFKELHIRAGEFFLDGTGAGAEAFKKLGYSAEELKRKLQDPSNLMVEILGKLRNFDQSGRSFLLEEIFGGAGGEQFSALIGQGESALRATIDRAHETGAVLDAELIAKAEELDRKFSELTTTAANFGKRVAVSFAAAGVEMVDFRARLDKIFPDEAQGRAILGDDLYNAMDRDRAMIEAQAADLERLSQAHQRLARDARSAAHEIGVSLQELPTEGFDDQRSALEANVAEMRRLADGIDNGTVSASEFQAGMDKATRETEAMFKAIQNDSGIYFVNVMSALDGLMGRLAGAIGLATSLRGALQQAASVDPTSKARQAELDRLAAEKASIASADALAAANDKFTASEQARNAATSDALRLEREVEAVRKRAKEAGATLTDAQARDAAAAALAGEAARQAADRASRGKGGAGGSKEKLDDFAREAQGIRDRTPALQTEAAVLATVAASQRNHGQAVEFARVKTDLLVAAQKAGQTMTPQLEAHIDKLADAYVNMAEKADKARKATSDMQKDAEAGAGALADLFMSGLDGADAFKGALLDLAKTILRNQLLNLFTMIPGVGKLGAMIRPGFAEGGYTGDGGKFEPAGVVHRGEYVFSKETVQRLGADNLDRLHQSARRGYADGGLVTATGKAMKAASGRPMDSAGASAPAVTINAPVTVNANGGTPEQNSDLAKQVARESENMFRGLVRDEMTRQMRPGGMLR